MNALTNELIGQSSNGELIVNNNPSKIRLEIENVPVEFNLFQNYPNPFNPKTKIAFTLAEDGLTTLRVYNSLGQQIKTIVNEFLYSGSLYEFEFDGTEFTSGIYFVKLVQRNKVQTRKIVLMKWFADAVDFCCVSFFQIFL